MSVVLEKDTIESSGTRKVNLIERESERICTRQSEEWGRIERIAKGKSPKAMVTQEVVFQTPKSAVGSEEQFSQLLP